MHHARPAFIAGAAHGLAPPLMPPGPPLPPGRVPAFPPGAHMGLMPPHFMTRPPGPPPRLAHPPFPAMLPRGGARPLYPAPPGMGMGMFARPQAPPPPPPPPPRAADSGRVMGADGGHPATAVGGPRRGGEAHGAEVMAESADAHGGVGGSSLPVPAVTEAVELATSTRPAPRFCERSMHDFTDRENIGEGMFGSVYRAKDAATGALVALKKVKMANEREGFPQTALREIKILRALRHPNIVALQDVVITQESANNRGLGTVYRVFEYCEYDLHGLLNSVRSLEPVHVKSYMKQLLQGVDFIHKNNIVHRDIKCANIFLTGDQVLKLGDWGLGRALQPGARRKYTQTVVTLWYRAPELLLGASRYDGAIDMWSVGCVFGELLKGSPIMPGKIEAEQLQLIAALCGSPSDDNWPSRKELPNWDKVAVKDSPCRIPDAFRGHDPLAVDLLQRMLALDPARRITADEALDHDYFWTDPLPPDDTRSLPRLPVASIHSLASRKQENQRRQRAPHGMPPAKRHAPVQR